MSEDRAVYGVKSVSWSLSNVWNAALEDEAARPNTPRDHLWASELGKSPIDLYLKLRGTPQTNPPNSRAKRKFEAGNLTEWMISLILARTGLLISTQERCEYQYPGLLKVTGKMDFLAGGKPNLEGWEEKSDQFPGIFYKAGKKIVEYISQNYPQGLEEKPLEIKSLSANMYDSLERRGSAAKNHRMQIFHYLKSTARPMGSIVYICRDDLRMREFHIFNNPHFEQEYKEAIERISVPHLTSARPSLEKSVVFNEDTGKFSANFNVGYSGYLTLLYGFPDQKAFDSQTKPIVSRWNRVLARLKDKKKLTQDNLTVLEEIRSAGYNPEAIAKEFSNDSELD